MHTITSAVARVLVDIGRARSLGQLSRIDNSPQVRSLTGSDQEVVAAAVSGRVLAVDYDQPVPRGGA